jgi:hypothetical protein
MFAKKNGIMVAVEPVWLNYALTSLWRSNFDLFFIRCSFGHVLHKKSKIAFLAIFWGLLGILTRQKRRDNIRPEKVNLQKIARKSLP